MVECTLYEQEKYTKHYCKNMTHIISINLQLPYKKDIVIVPVYTDEEMEIQGDWVAGSG